MKVAKKFLMMMLVGTMALNVTACSSGNDATRIAAAKEAGKAKAENQWHAEKVEVTDGDPNNLSNIVGKDTKDGKDREQVGKELESKNSEDSEEGQKIITYVIDRRTGLYHKVSCEEVDKISTVNRQNFYGSYNEAEAQTWQPCTKCKPNR